MGLKIPKQIKCPICGNYVWSTVFAVHLMAHGAKRR